MTANPLDKALDDWFAFITKREGERGEIMRRLIAYGARIHIAEVENLLFHYRLIIVYSRDKVGEFNITVPSGATLLRVRQTLIPNPPGYTCEGPTNHTEYDSCMAWLNSILQRKSPTEEFALGVWQDDQLHD